MLPSPALVVRMSPLGRARARVAASGGLPRTPRCRCRTAGCRARHRLRDRDDPVLQRVGDIERAVRGECDACRPIASAALSSRHGIPSATTCSLVTFGWPSGAVQSWIRTTVELSIVCTTLVRAAVQHVADEQRRGRPLCDRGHVPGSLDVRVRRSSHRTAADCRARSGSRTSRLPTCRWLSAGSRPRRIRPGGCPSAVVRPTPPGHDPGSAAR